MENKQIIEPTIPIVLPQVLINQEYFKAYSPIPKNYDWTDIFPFVKISETIWIEPILGEALYEELLNQVNENKLTDINSTLILQIYPYETLAIQYESMPFIAYNYSEVGITKGHSENSDSVSINDVNYITKHVKAQLDYCKKRLKQFLDTHKEFFPLYKPDTCENNINNISCNNNWLIDFYDGFYTSFNPNVYNRPNPSYRVYAMRKRNINIQ